jgi:hypothetical protein
MSNLVGEGRTNLLRASLVAIGIGLVVGATVLGASGLVSGTSTAGHPGRVASYSTLVKSATGARVHSHAWGISTGPTTSTGSMSVPAGSDVFVFVGFINARIGGGSISSITDSSGDAYAQVATTGFANNHTESLFLAKDVPAASALTVSVSFAGGAATQGGSVAAVDVVGAAGSPINVKAKDSGVGSVASVGLETTSSGDLFLLGVSGQAKIANMTAGNHEHLLNTAGATAGPFTDGEGFGTFTAKGETGVFALAAGLDHAAVWNGIVVGIRPATTST